MMLWFSYDKTGYQTVTVFFPGRLMKSDIDKHII